MGKPKHTPRITIHLFMHVCSCVSAINGCIQAVLSLRLSNLLTCAGQMYTNTRACTYTSVCVCVHLDLPLYIYTHPQEDLSVFRKSSPKQQGKNRPRILETRRKLLTNIRPEGLPDLNSRVKVHFVLAGPCKMTCNILTCQHN